MPITYPDPLPFKLRVLKAITGALKEITPGAGYEFDMSDYDDNGETRSRVFRGRAWFGDDDPLPMISVLEGVSPADEVAEPPAAAPGAGYHWPLIVQGFVDDDPENPTDPAYVLLADVRRRLQEEKVRVLEGSRGMPDPFGFGPGKNRVVSLTIGAGVVRPADDVSAKAYFWLSLVPEITEATGEPYV